MNAMRQRYEFLVGCDRIGSGGAGTPTKVNKPLRFLRHDIHKLLL